MNMFCSNLVEYFDISQKWTEAVSDLYYENIITRNKFLEVGDYSKYDSFSKRNLELMDLILEKIEINAITECPLSIQYIDNPSEKIQLLSVKLDKQSLEYIKDPKFSVLMEANQLKI